MGQTNDAGAVSFEIEERASLQTGEGEEIPSIHLPWEVLGRLCWTLAAGYSVVASRLKGTKRNKRLFSTDTVCAAPSASSSSHRFSSHRSCPNNIPRSPLLLPSFLHARHQRAGAQGEGPGAIRIPSEGTRCRWCNTDTAHMHHEEQRALHRLNTRCRSCDNKARSMYEGATGHGPLPKERRDDPAVPRTQAGPGVPPSPRRGDNTGQELYFRGQTLSLYVYEHHYGGGTVVRQ